MKKFSFLLILFFVSSFCAQYSSATAIIVDRLLDDPDTSKSALLPGETSSLYNFTNRVGGLSSIFIDVNGLGNAAALSASDFELRIGNSGVPSTWSLLSSSPTVSLASGIGAGGSDRIQINFISIENSWLQIRMLATVNTGLSTFDEFYFGHSFGDVNGDGALSAIDPLSIINKLNSDGSGPVDVTSPYDISGDGTLSALDALLVINALNAGGHDPLVSFTAPTLDTSTGTGTEGIPGNGPQPVPEPPVLGLLFLGLIALIMKGRRLNPSLLKV